MSTTIPVIENARAEDYTALSLHSRADLAGRAAVRQLRAGKVGVVILHDKPACCATCARWYVAIPRAASCALVRSGPAGGLVSGTTLAEVRRAFKTIAEKPNVRRGVISRSFDSQNVNRADARAIVLGVPVSWIVLRDLCALKSIPDTATVEVFDPDRGTSARVLRVRWDKGNGRRGGLDLVQPLGVPERGTFEVLV